MPTGDEADLKRRAMAAYFKTGGIDQPSQGGQVLIVGGLQYVLLSSGGRILAVYRVDTVGRLKRLKRWPKEIDAAA